MAQMQQIQSFRSRLQARIEAMSSTLKAAKQVEPILPELIEDPPAISVPQIIPVPEKILNTEIESDHAKQNDNKFDLSTEIIDDDSLPFSFQDPFSEPAVQSKETQPPENEQQQKEQEKQQSTTTREWQNKRWYLLKQEQQLKSSKSPVLVIDQTDYFKSTGLNSKVQDDEDEDMLCSGNNGSKDDLTEEPEFKLENLTDDLLDINQFIDSKADDGMSGSTGIMSGGSCGSSRNNSSSGSSSVSKSSVTKPSSPVVKQNENPSRKIEAFNLKRKFAVAAAAIAETNMANARTDFKQKVFVDKENSHPNTVVSSVDTSTATAVVAASPNVYLQQKEKQEKSLLVGQKKEELQSITSEVQEKSGQKSSNINQVAQNSEQKYQEQQQHANGDGNSSNSSSKKMNRKQQKVIVKKYSKFQLVDFSKEPGLSSTSQSSEANQNQLSKVEDQLEEKSFLGGCVKKYPKIELEKIKFLAECEEQRMKQISQLKAQVIKMDFL